MSEEKGLTREDLKYMFDAASEKFFKEFKAVKTEPIITINSSSAPVSVEEINRELARRLRESADTAIGGCYSEDSSRATIVKKIKKSELIKEIHDAVIENLSCGITIDLDVPSASCEIGYPAGAAEKAAESVIKKYIGVTQVID